MNSNHIHQLLEERSLPSLTAEELARIEEHTAQCESCTTAYESARIAFAMLQERSALQVEPSPFFQTRVMAAIREHRQEAETFNILKMWRTARTMLASMAALVVLLTSITVYTNYLTSETVHTSLSYNAETADFVLYGRDDFDEQAISNSQMISNVYDLEGENSDGK